MKKSALSPTHLYYKRALTKKNRWDELVPGANPTIFEFTATTPAL
jgi:hypothetical protein